MSQPLCDSVNFPDTSTEMPGEELRQAFPETILSVLPHFPTVSLNPHPPKLLVKVKLILNQRKADFSNKSVLLFPIQMVRIFERK